MHLERANQVHCVVVDDHVMVLQMLCGVLRTRPGIRVVGTGSGLDEAAQLASLRRIDVLVADAFLMDGCGLDVLRSLFQAHAGLKCIVLTDGRTLGTLPDDVAQRVIAVIAKTASCEELLSAVETAAGSQAATLGAAPSQDQLRALLTTREYDVLAALGQGLSNKEVANTLEIAVRTVETHRKAISKKLGCNGAALLRIAFINSLTSLG